MLVFPESLRFLSSFTAQYSLASGRVKTRPYSGAFNNWQKNCDLYFFGSLKGTPMGCLWWLYQAFSFSKCSLIICRSAGVSRKMAMRLGTVIKPLKVSLMPQIRARSVVAPTMETSA